MTSTLTEYALPLLFLLLAVIAGMVASRIRRSGNLAPRSAVLPISAERQNLLSGSTINGAANPHPRVLVVNSADYPS